MEMADKQKALEEAINEAVDSRPSFNAKDDLTSGDIVEVLMDMAVRLSDDTGYEIVVSQGGLRVLKHR